MNERDDRKRSFPVLQALDFKVRGRQKSGDAPPFLGVSMDLGELDRLQSAIKTVSSFDGLSPDRLISKYPYAVSWAICALLSIKYGEDKHYIWPIIDQLFGRKLSPNQRNSLTEGFRFACRKLGLAADGFERNVDLFLMHAGVAREQLIHIARCFLAQHASIGPPPADDVVHLNRWEDDSMQFLPIGVEVPRRPILHDETAWHAYLYLEWTRDTANLEGAGGFLETFANAIKQAKDERGKGRRVEIAPQPRIAWHHGRLVIHFPKMPGRVKVDAGEGIQRVRADKPYSVPLPTPQHVNWQSGERSGQIELFRDPSDFLLFDEEDGRLVLHWSRTGGAQARAPVPRGLVVSPSQFCIDGESAEPVAPGLFAAPVELTKGPVSIQAQSATVKLESIARSRISFLGQRVAEGVGGTPDLWGPDTVVSVEPGAFRGQPVHLGVEIGGEGRVVDLPGDDQAHYSVTIAEILSKADIDPLGDPLLVDLVLMRTPLGSDQPVPTRIRKTCALWPGYLGRSDNLLDSAEAPRNLLEDQLKFAARDDRGRVCLDRSGGYEAALLAFDLGRRNGQFLVGPQGLSLSYEDASGRMSRVDLGASLVFGDEDRAGAVILGSPDAKASLIVRGRVVERPFAANGRWAVPVGQLLQDGPPTLVYVDSKGTETVLLAIENSTSPRRFDLKVYSDRSELALEMPSNIGGVRIHLRSDIGEEWLGELPFDHLQSTVPPQDWLSGKGFGAGGALIRITCPRRSSGLSLGDVSVREVGATTWSPLRNARRDKYCVAVTVPEGTEAAVTARQLRNVMRWTEECFAREAWDGGLGASLISRWAKLARDVERQPGGVARLLLIAHEEQEELSWLPMKHLVEAVPHLHQAPDVAFHALADTASPAGRALSIMSSLRTMRLRENDRLSQVALIAFNNWRAAQSEDATLRGFNTDRLMTTLAHVPEGDALSWNGKEVLGADHLAASRIMFEARCEDFGLFFTDESDSPMSVRGARLNVVMRAMAKNVPSAKLDAQGSEVTDWAQAALRAYATAARGEKVSQFVASTATVTGLEESEVLSSVGELCRLAPEMLSFFLICSELERYRS